MVPGSVQATKLQGRGGLFEKPIPVQKITAHDFVSTCTWDASRVLWKFVIKDSIDASTRQAYKTTDTDIWQLAKFLCCRKAVHNNFDTNENEISFVFVFCMHHKNWPYGTRKNGNEKYFVFVLKASTALRAYFLRQNKIFSCCSCTHNQITNKIAYRFCCSDKK